MQQAISAAVRHIEGDKDKDCRVLVLGCGAGLLGLMALAAGAKHVTCVDRWLYLAHSCKQLFQHNNVPLEKYKVREHQSF